MSYDEQTCTKLKLFFLQPAPITDLLILHYHIIKINKVAQATEGSHFCPHTSFLKERNMAFIWYGILENTSFLKERNMVFIWVSGLVLYLFSLSHQSFKMVAKTLLHGLICHHLLKKVQWKLSVANLYHAKNLIKVQLSAFT